ncbi:MAG: hypothetical protein GIKADHBN_02824 [Phycisphaerales bacterium]|nr:hypothetical protein [Phycisphaerales bacterium]
MRELLASELARLERGPRRSHPDVERPGLLASVLIAFGAPDVIAIAAGMAGRALGADSVKVLLGTWGVLSTSGVVLLLLAPRVLGAWLARPETRMFLPEYRPKGSRAAALRAALSAGVMHRAEFEVTELVTGPAVDDEGPVMLVRVGESRWLVLRDPEIDDAFESEAGITLMVAPVLRIDWIEATGDLVELKELGQRRSVRAAGTLGENEGPFVGVELWMRAVTLVRWDRHEAS